MVLVNDEIKPFLEDLIEYELEKRITNNLNLNFGDLGNLQNCAEAIISNFLSISMFIIPKYIDSCSIVQYIQECTYYREYNNKVYDIEEGSIFDEEGYYIDLENETFTDVITDNLDLWKSYYTNLFTTRILNGKYK